MFRPPPYGPAADADQDETDEQHGCDVTYPLGDQAAVPEHDRDVRVRVVAEHVVAHRRSGAERRAGSRATAEQVINRRAVDTTNDIANSGVRGAGWRVEHEPVDGVVFGTRALAPLMETSGGAIVATASLAGLLPYPFDPIYAGTKHFVVGFVRSVAPTLQLRGITINAVCPGMVDTPLLGDGRARLTEMGLPLIPASEIADAVVLAATSGGTGICYSCRAGRPPVAHEFSDPIPF